MKRPDCVDGASAAAAASLIASFRIATPLSQANRRVVFRNSVHRRPKSLTSRPSKGQGARSNRNSNPSSDVASLPHPISPFSFFPRRVSCSANEKRPPQRQLRLFMLDSNALSSVWPPLAWSQRPSRRNRSPHAGITTAAGDRPLFGSCLFCKIPPCSPHHV